MRDASATDPSPSTSDGPPRSDRAQAVDDLASRFSVLADEDFTGYCPIYERIARAIAADRPSLSIVAGLAPTGRAPVLLFAAVHDLVLADPTNPLAGIYAGTSTADPWPAFRDLLHRRRADVAARMRTRSIQTNEVGRSAALLPALAQVRLDARAVGDDRPIALVELGPSAGLNLLADRYHVSYRRGAEVVATAGDPSSPVRLDCELRGPGSPPPVGPLGVVTRTGLDLAPVDVTDDDACRWLAACIWPGVPDRPERLAAALTVARATPPSLHTGDAATELAPLLAGLPDDVLPVVVSTWALAYLGRDGRRLLGASLDDLGRRRDLVLVTAEEPRHTDWLEPPPDEVQGCGSADGDGTDTVLGTRSWRDGRTADHTLALCHPHVRWMAWVPDERRRP